MTAAKGNGDWGLGIEPNPQSPFPLAAVIHDLCYIFKAKQISKK